MTFTVYIAIEILKEINILLACDILLLVLHICDIFSTRKWNDNMAFTEQITPSKLQVIKTKDNSNLSCLSYFLPGPRPRLAWDNFEKHFTLKSTCCEPKVCFRIWGIFKEHLLYMQTLAHFLIRSLPSSFVLNYIHTNIVSELYMQRLRIPWSLETLCQGPSPKLHNPPFRLLPYSAFCP